MDKLFWVDQAFRKTYSELLFDLNKLNKPKKFIKEKQAYGVFLRLIHSLIHDYPIVLLDGDFSDDEITVNGFSLEEINETFKIKQCAVNSFEHILLKIKKLENWNITLLTSGTTGIPKKICHDLSSISKAVRITKKHKDDIWAYAYNPTHMAGIQLFFQAFFNKNTMINVFQFCPKDIRETLKEFKINYISATPTFYRMLCDNESIFPDIDQISSGGEKLSLELKKKLLTMFPNAKTRNIYASTEAGSLFASDGEYFTIPARYREKIKIKDNEIIIHHSMLGKSNNYSLIEDWYHSGDMVEIIEIDPLIKFRFISRKNQMINVGGYKVNPEEVEEALLRNPKIIAAKVYGKENPVLGNILCADLVSEGITEKEIRQGLEMQAFKIPRIIKFVDKLDLTRTGKVKR